MTTKVIIIDDEKMARTLLSGMLDELNLNLTIVELCEDLPAGVKAIRKHKPDLIFLDIEMPGHSGLELLDFFDKEEVTFSIIFTTAYNQYAIQAFKLSAIDYLLKPISSEDLAQAITRYKHTINDEKPYTILKENLLTNPLKKIAVNTLSSTKFIQLSDIVFIKADGAYSQIHLSDQNVITSSKGLKYYEDVLDGHLEFMRCHKSFIVNLNYVAEYVKTDGGFLLMQNKLQVSLSSEKSEELLKRMS